MAENQRRRCSYEEARHETHSEESGRHNIAADYDPMGPHGNRTMVFAREWSIWTRCETSEEEDKGKQEEEGQGKEAWCTSKHHQIQQPGILVCISIVSNPAKKGPWVC